MFKSLKSVLLKKRKKCLDWDCWATTKWCANCWKAVELWWTVGPAQCVFSLESSEVQPIHQQFSENTLPLQQHILDLLLPHHVASKTLETNRSQRVCFRDNHNLPSTPRTYFLLVGLQMSTYSSREVSDSNSVHRKLDAVPEHTLRPKPRLLYSKCISYSALRVPVDYLKRKYIYHTELHWVTISNSNMPKQNTHFWVPRYHRPYQKGGLTLDSVCPLSSADSNLGWEEKLQSTCYYWA